jgi:hypothetical protein
MAENQSIFLLVGKSGTGKTTSLRNLPLDKTIILNSENKSLLPFKGASKVYRHHQVTEISKFLRGLASIIKDDKAEYIVLDSLTFLMSMYETQVICKAANTMKAWGDYQQFYKEFIHLLKTSDKKVIITAHPSEVLDEGTGLINQNVSVKGALKGFIEADFNVVIYTRVVADEETGTIKYGFYTNKTKESLSTSVKSPIGMFESAVLDDNDAMVIFKAIEDYKNS